jgi:SAM-dependent methyltransferase
VGIEDFYEDNKANWNDRARVHAHSTMYRLDEYKNDPDTISSVVQFDADQFGSFAGLHIAHLQCHIGTDTISLERLGAASVVGVDFAPDAIAEARSLARASGSNARFVEASIYDAPSAVGETVDLVYTSVGTICWLHDINRWANAVAKLLEPGGRFYIRDTHPFLFVFEEIEGVIEPHYRYRYTPEEPLSWDEPSTYTDDPAGVGIAKTRHHEWNHSIPDVVNALVQAGMRIDRMAEHEGIPWQFVPSCTREGELWYLPEPLRSQVPALFSLEATKL